MPGRLQIRLLYYSLIITIVPIVCIGFTFFHNQKHLLENQAKLTLKTASYHAADTTNMFIEERINDLTYLSHNSGITNDKTESLELLEKYISLKPAYSGYIYVSSEGEIWRENGPSEIGKTFLESESFSRAMNGQRFLSKVYTKEDEKPFFWICTPLYTKNEELAGIFAPSFDIFYLWKQVTSKLELEDEKLPYTAFVINKDGWIVTHQDERDIMNRNFLTENDLTIDRINEAIAKRQLLESSDGKSIYAVNPIETKEIAEEDWYIVTTTEKQVVYAPLRELFVRYLLISIPILVAIIAAAYYMTKLIIKPVEVMVERVEKYSRGERFSRTESAYHEINVLNRAFQSMVEAIEQREKELLRTEKLKYVGQLAAGVAHEIRNPITTIRGFFQLLKDHPYDEKVFRNYIDIIIEELNRMNGIVGELLNLSKPYQLVVKEHNINELMDEIILLQRGELHKKNIKIIRENECDKLICTDRNRLYQVIINVIQNSRDAFQKEGSIRISFESTDDKVRIIIVDDGPGMPKGVLSKIGTPFYTTKEHGTGLGIATSMKIMEELEGSFEISSKIGKGTKIVLVVPAKK